MNKKYFIAILSIFLVSIGIYLWTQNNQRNLENPLVTANVSETIEIKNNNTFNLTAGFVEKEINDKKFKMLGYNKMIPGPLLKIKQGSEIAINFKNETDLSNTIHFHGIRTYNSSDGVPDLTQKIVEPNASFTYKLNFPDPGIYWYHPHFRDDYALELGLYGGILVTPEDENYWSPVNREIPLFLDDILIEDGEINLSKEKTDRTLMGRFGNVMLVNGETNYNLSVKKGEIIRFYLINSANTRTFNFTIPEAKIKSVGSDSGAYEKEEWKDSIVISPSERAIIEVLFDKAGTFNIEHKTPEKTYNLGEITVSNEQVEASYTTNFMQLKTNEDVVESIDPFRLHFNSEADKEITLTIDMHGMAMNHKSHMMPDGSMMSNSMMQYGNDDSIEWEDEMAMMNQMSTTDSVKWKFIDQETGKENMNINWIFEKAKPVKISIFNDPNTMHPMQHPIHFHGQKFLVLSRNNILQENLVWKDTVLVKAGETVDILLDTSNPGIWMAHCHILEHIEAGMMFTFKIE